MSRLEASARRSETLRLEERCLCRMSGTTAVHGRFAPPWDGFVPPEAPPEKVRLHTGCGLELPALQKGESWSGSSNRNHPAQKIVTPGLQTHYQKVVGVVWGGLTTF